MSFMDIYMSFHDVFPLAISYGPASHGPTAPQGMAHSVGGAFQLMHLNLFEMNEGPTRSREHLHDVYHVVIFEEADNQMRLNGKLLETHRGLCVMTHPEDSHCFSPKRPGRTEFLRGVLTCAEDFEHAPPRVRKAGRQGSGILRSMSRANCFIMLPPDCNGVAPGDTVMVQPFEALF